MTRKTRIKGDDVVESLAANYFLKEALGAARSLRAVDPLKWSFFSNFLAAFPQIDPKNKKIGWTSTLRWLMFFFLGGCFFQFLPFSMPKKSHNFGDRKAGELSSIQHFGGGPLVSSPQIFCRFLLFVSEKTPPGYIWRLSTSLTRSEAGPKSGFKKKHEILGDCRYSVGNIEFASLVFSRASWVHFVAIALDPNLKRVPDIIVSMWCLRVFLHPFLYMIYTHKSSGSYWDDHTSNHRILEMSFWVEPDCKASKEKTCL